MRKDHKFVKSVLETWGTYKRTSSSVLGLPKSTPAFDPSNYEYKYAATPSWRRKRILPADEKKYRQMRQQSTKPSMGARVPNYIGNSAMSHVDDLVKKLPKIYREVAEKKFIDERKDKEIAEEIQRSISTVEKRVKYIYKTINDRMDRSYFRRNTINRKKTAIRA